MPLADWSGCLSSLKDKPFEEVLGEIRAFGRDNSGALIAGAVLAGIALGRFIKSSAVPARTEAGLLFPILVRALMTLTHRTHGDGESSARTTVVNDGWAAYEQWRPDDERESEASLRTVVAWGR